ncbi:MAG: LemA family protein [Caldimonas sp.]
MMSLQVGVWIAVAVLLFWTVGAYNRLVRLRNAIVAGFSPVDAQFCARDALLHQQLEAVAPMLEKAAPRLEALQAACTQADLARIHAKAHPGAPGAITSLRLADDILSEARARVPVQAIGGSEVAELSAQLAACDTALGFARAQFNTAVLDYNRAVRQIPTRLIAAVFGFAPSGTL